MRRQLSWSLGIAFVFEMSYFMVTPLIPLHLTGLGASPAELGLWLAWAASVPAFLSLFLGRMVDRLGLRRGLLGGAAIVATGVGALALVSPLWLAALFIGLFYLGDATVVIANQVYIGSLGTPEQRVRNYGWFGAFMNIGAMVGPVVGGVLADWRGAEVSFLAAAAITGGAIALFPLLPAVERAAAPAPNSGRGEGVWRQSLALLGLGAIQYAIFAVMLIQLGGGARNSYYPLYLAEVGYSPTRIGVLFAVHSLAGVTVRAATGWLSDRLGNHRLMLLAITTCAASLILTPLGGEFAVQAALAALLGAAHSLIQPLTNASLVAQVSPSDRGLVFGLRMSLQRAIGVVIPLILGGVAGLFGVGAPILAAGLIMLLGLLPLHLLNRRNSRSKAEAA